MAKWISFLMSFCACLCADAWAAGDFSPVFSDNMVLQRGKPIAIWGTSDGVEALTLRFAGHCVQVKPCEGKWQTQLPAIDAGGPYELTLESSDGARTLKNVLVGDVWLAGGQSNMQWPVKNLANGGAAARALASNPQIRMIQIVRNPDDSGEVGRKPQSGWVVATGPTIDGYSAVAFYFASFLQPKVGVPVGIIDCNWGGTGAEAWISPKSMASNSTFKGLLDDYAQALKKFPAEYEKYKSAAAAYRADKTKPVPVMPMGPYHHRRPSGLYETMLSKIAPYTLRGFIFYQGESNRFTPGIYKELFESLIADWRSEWNDETLPFLFVQLAGYAKADFRAIRAAQQAVWNAVPGAAMVTAIDVGEAESIHPLDKETVGRRLSNLALAEVYGLEGVCAYGPLVKASVFSEGMCVLRFAHAEGGLSADGSVLLGFELSGKDKRFYPAQAVIVGENAVCVSSDKVPMPVAVRYAWKAFPESNLRNAAGLPAFPYKSDDWADDPQVDLAILALPTPSTPAGVPLSFSPETRESKAVAVSVGPTTAWQSQPLPGDRPDVLRFLHFKADTQGASLRGADAVVLHIQYLDMGDTRLRIEYDSVDGPWKVSPTEVPIGNTLIWKTADVLLKNTKFSGRQHGHDVRLRVMGGQNVIIRGIWAEAAEQGKFPHAS